MSFDAKPLNVCYETDRVHLKVNKLHKESSRKVAKSYTAKSSHITHLSTITHSILILRHGISTEVLGVHLEHVVQQAPKYKYIMVISAVTVLSSILMADATSVCFMIDCFDNNAILWMRNKMSFIFVPSRIYIFE